MNNGQLTADEARQLGRDSNHERALLNRVYGLIRDAAVRGDNTLDVEGMNEVAAACIIDDLRENGFHVLVLPWKMTVRWL